MAATPLGNDRSLLTVIARMTATPGELDDPLEGGADGLVITRVERIA